MIAMEAAGTAIRRILVFSNHRCLIGLIALMCAVDRGRLACRRQRSRQATGTTSRRPFRRSVPGQVQGHEATARCKSRKQESRNRSAPRWPRRSRRVPGVRRRRRVNLESVRKPRTRTRIRPAGASAVLKGLRRGFRLVPLSIHRSRSKRCHNRRGRVSWQRIGSQVRPWCNSLPGHTTTCPQWTAEIGAAVCPEGCGNLAHSGRARFRCANPTHISGRIRRRHLDGWRFG